LTADTYRIVYRWPQGKGESGIEAIEKRHWSAHKQKSDPGKAAFVDKLIIK